MPRTHLPYLLLLTFLLLTGCEEYPQDTIGTLKDAQYDILKVGVVEHSPFVIRENGEWKGIEPALVEAFAKDIGAEVEWVAASESELVDMMEHYDIHLLIGGFEKSTLWKKKAALTNPYFAKRVLLVPKGESAFLVRLEESLHRHRELTHELTKKFLQQ